MNYHQELEEQQLWHQCLVQAIATEQRPSSDKWGVLLERSTDDPHNSMGKFFKGATMLPLES